MIPMVHPSTTSQSMGPTLRQGRPARNMTRCQLPTARNKRCATRHRPPPRACAHQWPWAAQGFQGPKAEGWAPGPLSPNPKALEGMGRRAATGQGDHGHNRAINTDTAPLAACRAPRARGTLCRNPRPARHMLRGTRDILRAARTLRAARPSPRSDEDARHEL